MNWQLVSKNEIRYFEFAWNNRSAIYSTRYGQQSLVHTLRPIFLKQTHSAVIVDVDVQREKTGDGLMSTMGKCLGIKIADCLPVYFFSSERICIIHCGWRGILEGIVRNAQEILGSFHYVLGASIGPCCYEVKEDVATFFKEDYAGALLTRNGKYYVDLKSAVVRDLGSEKLIASLNLCTKCHPEFFYSNRNGDTNRNYAILSQNTIDSAFGSE